jgi:hypothetical protein
MNTYQLTTGRSNSKNCTTQILLGVRMKRRKKTQTQKKTRVKTTGEVTPRLPFQLLFFLLPVACCCLLLPVVACCCLLLPVVACCCCCLLPLHVFTVCFSVFLTHSFPLHSTGPRYCADNDNNDWSFVRSLQGHA